jgi:hypothetical protein
MRQEVEERVPRQGPHRQGDQELDEVLVEDALHYRDDNDAEYSAEGDEEDGSRGREPDPVVLHVPGLLQPDVGGVVGPLRVRVVLVRAVVVALVPVLRPLGVVVLLGGVVMLLAVSEECEAEEAEAVAHRMPHLEADLH